MDNNDINGIGSSIMDAVEDAINRGDFTGLNEAIRQTVWDTAGAAESLYNYRGNNQGIPGARRGSGTRGQERTYGHAGRSAGNLTEQYMQRASGARHHTIFTSRISPFLQRRISRSSGTGKIVGGIACLVMASFSFVDSLFSGLLGMFSSVGFFSAMGITGLVVTLGLAVLGAILVKSGKERKQLVKDYYEYGRVAGTSEYLEINKLARATGQTREQVLENLEKMISEDMLPAAWFDKQKTTLMLSERMYNEYLRLEKERQEQEAEAAKEKMRANAAGKGVSEEAFAQVDEDLRPKPEDARLPAEAKKIVEEGLLYMGRIRAANDEIGDQEISDELYHLETTMKRIIEQIRKDPSSAPNLRRLMVYYLPTTMKLLEAYIELDRQPVAGENIASTKQEIKEALGTINIAFENLLDGLFQDMAWDISSDISVMKTMMAQDGLTGDQMRRAAKQEQAAETAQTAQPEQTAQTSAGYTDGYSDDLTENAEGVQAFAGSMQAAAPGTEEEKSGIKLTFGE